MDADRALLRQAEEGQVGWRLYTWSESCVTLGRSQQPERDLLPECPVGYAMRPTGGRAVLHGHDLTVGLAFPLAHLGLAAGEKSIRRVYREAIRSLVAALCQAGVDVRLAEDLARDPSRGRSADCFVQVSNNDIVLADTSQKVCGCALQLTETAVLVQASIPVGKPLVDPSLVYRIPAQVVPISLSESRLRTALEEQIFACR